MKNKLLLFFLFLFSFLDPILAQNVDTMMSVYSEKLTAEKIHIHFDRSVYRKGETIYYKIYITDDYNAFTQSKNIYTIWYDVTGKLIKQTVAPVFLSSAKGSFSIPENYKGEALYIKAYTRWILNFDTFFIYTKRIAVFQDLKVNHKNNTKPQAMSDSSSIRIFPEGGFAVEGLLNHFGFCATTAYKSPAVFRGVIKNDEEVIDSVITKHDGMGSFSFQSKKGKKYFFEWYDENGLAKTKPIEIEKQSGACLHVEPSYGKSIFTVERSENPAPAFRFMHLLIHKNYLIRYKIDLNLSQKQTLSSEISTLDLPTGIVQFTLFDANWTPVAERIVFIDNNNYSFHPHITFDHAGQNENSRSRLDIFVSDTLLSNMSVSVVRINLLDTTEPTIFSDILLTDELKGNVNNPAYYFSEIKFENTAAENRIREDLDLVMLTHGHRRYDWEKITKGVLPAMKYAQDTSYLGIAGELKNTKLFTKKNTGVLTVMFYGKDKKKSLLTIPIKKDGSFREDNVLLSDTVNVIAALNGTIIKKSDIVFFDNNFINHDKHESDENSLLTLPKHEKNDTIAKQTMIFLAEQERIDSLKKSTTLKEVIVKTRIKSKIQVLDEYYTNGVFSGEGSNYNIDVEGDIHAAGNNIWNYLQSKIPGLKVTYNYGEYIPEWFPDPRGNLSVPALFLDEVPIELESMNSINIESIAYVKAFRPPFVGAFLNGVHGAIAIYSKKGYSPIYETDSTSEKTVVLHGYTKYKEFNSDAFADSPTSQAADNYTPVLYYNPFVITDKNNQHTEINFNDKGVYNKIAIIIEGINTEGKLAHVVKVIN